MRVSVTRTEDDTTGGPLISVGPAGVLTGDVLTHRMHLGSGVHLDVDLMARCHWRGLTFQAMGGTARPLLTRLLGTRAADAAVLDDAAERGDVVTADTADAVPWSRVAVVDALDRWLHLPLDQSLVDAERGVSRARAAAALPDGPLRGGLMAESLMLARQASRGLVRYLHELAADGVVAPALDAALRRLVDGYRELVNGLDGRDDELDAVLEEWRELEERGSKRLGARHLEMPATALAGHPPGPGASTIDPRQSHARTFAMAPDLTSAEVSVTPGAGRDREKVTVRAAAFGPWVAPEVLSRLMVRLVDRRSGSLGGHAQLTSARRPTRSRGAASLTALVPLRGLDPAGIRADLFDVLVIRPPAVDDADDELRRARRAVAVLGEWRRLLALAQMPVRPAESAPLLRKSVCVLPDGAVGPDPDEPICIGAPSERQLRAAESVDAMALLALLREYGGSGTPRPARETAALTVAELAAANASLTG